MSKYITRRGQCSLKKSGEAIQDSSLNFQLSPTLFIRGGRQATFCLLSSVASYSINGPHYLYGDGSGSCGGAIRNVGPR